MSRVAYVNGRYVPHREGAVHIEDRGYQFADGVYEVIAIHRGRLVDEDGHMARLERSLAELRMDAPMARNALGVVMREVVRRNRVSDGIVYLQITRGVAPRDHAFPGRSRPALVMTARRTGPMDMEALRRGVSVITIPDIRWQRCDIKSVSLLPNVLGKQQARQAGAYEAWMVDGDGFVTEGTSTNAWIVTPEGELVTRHLGSAILNGITRIALLGLARDEGISVVERPFSVDEAKAARESFVTSTTSFVKPVTRIDDTPIGNGNIGEVTERLLDAYADYMGRMDKAETAL